MGPTGNFRTFDSTLPPILQDVRTHPNQPRVDLFAVIDLFVRDLTFRVFF
jgi:hypothetical protein